MADVQGTPVSVSAGEQVAPLQANAPNPVPATAAPSQDQVTINTHLRKVVDELHATVAYVRSFLKEHPVAEDVVKKLEELETVVEAEVK